MFFEAPSNSAFAGYADGNTPYSYSSIMQIVLNNLQEAIEILLMVFCKLSCSKCRQMPSTN